MKNNVLTPLYLVAFAAIIGMSWSCTKENASAPSQQTAVSAQNDSQEDAVATAVTPGIYAILQFIDSGDDITAKYNGYTFEFKADGTLVATTGTGDVFTGRWKQNSAQTKMNIQIHGNAALNNLTDDSWKTPTITANKIVIKKSGPDKVTFVMQ